MMVLKNYKYQERMFLYNHKVGRVVSCQLQIQKTLKKVEVKRTKL